jgi:hypothetical protein
MAASASAIAPSRNFIGIRAKGAVRKACLRIGPCRRPHRRDTGVAMPASTMLSG